MAHNEPDTYRSCPYPDCRRAIREAALVCFYCNRSVDMTGPEPEEGRAAVGAYRKLGEIAARRWESHRLSWYSAVLLSGMGASLLALGVTLTSGVHTPAFTLPPEPSPAAVRAYWQADTARRIRETRGTFFAAHPEYDDAAAKEGFSRGLPLKAPGGVRDGGVRDGVIGGGIRDGRS